MPPLSAALSTDDDLAPPDRPDQIMIDPEDGPELVSFLETTHGDEPGDRNDTPREANAQSASTRDDVRPEPVEPREARRREDYEDEPLLRSEGDDTEDDSRSRRRRALRRRDGDADDEDRQSYSKSVQRRINREIALRKRTEAQLAEERAARQRIEARLARIERVQMDEQGEASLRQLDEQIRQLTEELARAEEDGDTKKKVELQVKLSELQAQKATLKDRLERERAERTRRAQQDEEPVDTARPRYRTSARTAEWVRANRRWWNIARWRDAHQDAIAHDETILAEIEDGELDFEPYSDEHFQELCRRLKADYPDLEVRTIDGEVFELDDAGGDDVYDGDSRGDRMSRSHDNRNGARRAPMGGLGGRDGRRERSEVELARRGKVQLTEEDFATMRIFKLDPNNPEHKQYFAKERARTILSGAMRGGARR